MPIELTTQHYVVDLKTGFAYGLKLDAEGNCKSVTPMNVALERLDQTVLHRFSPIGTYDEDGNPPPTLPFGKTIQAVEIVGNKFGKVYTVVFPTEKEYEDGAKPQVSAKDLPPDLIKAGIAPPAKMKAGEKPSVVDEEAALKESLKTIDHMIGLGKAKRDIRQNIAVARFNRAKEELGLTAQPISRHMVFTGNPGTGKTTFAREVAKVYHALGFIQKPTVHEVKREDLVAGYVGQTALKTKEQIEKAKGGILFIDEAYALSRGSGDGHNADFGREAIDTLVAAMENMRENLIVIVAGYPDEMRKFIDANEGLKSRFMTYINFEDYSMKELGQILDIMVADRGYKLDADARAHAMDLLDAEKNRVDSKSFGNGRVVRNLVEKVEKELAERLDREGVLAPGRGGLTKDEMKAALTTIKLTDMKGVSLASLEGTASTPLSIGFGDATVIKRFREPVNDDATNKAAAPPPPKTVMPPQMSFK